MKKWRPTLFFFALKQIGSAVTVGGHRSASCVLSFGTETLFSPLIYLFFRSLLPFYHSMFQNGGECAGACLRLAMYVCPEHEQLRLPLLCNSLVCVGSSTEAKQCLLSQLVLSEKGTGVRTVGSQWLSVLMFPLLVWLFLWQHIGILMSYSLEVSLDLWKSVYYDTMAKTVEDKFPKYLVKSNCCCSQSSYIPFTGWWDLNNLWHV